jgi:ABC-type branched-subunit amino acid transport system substrate-binding protein
MSKSISGNIRRIKALKWTRLTIVPVIVLLLLALIGAPILSVQAASTPSLKVNSPNGGEHWLIGTDQTIKWKSNPSGGYVVIELSRDRGETWETIIPFTKNDGRQTWAVCGPAADQARIKVSFFNSSGIYDISDTDFFIDQGIGEIRVTSPNGGESWLAGSDHLIKWKSSYKGSYVKIDVSRDGGETWETIIPFAPNDGVQSWAVSGPTAQARIKVTSIENPDIMDTTDNSFNITLPSITVISPNGGESWLSGSDRTIKWKTGYKGGFVKIELAKSGPALDTIEGSGGGGGGGGYDWETIIPFTKNDGSQTWPVYSETITEARMRISSIENPDIYDMSNAGFTITIPEAANPKTLKIGLITSITGPLAPGFKSIYDAVKPTQDLLNQLGGLTVNGEKYDIAIVTADDKSSPQDAVAAANKLIQDGIKYIIMPIFPPNCMAILPVTEKAKIITINCASNDPAQFYTNQYYFDAFMPIYSIPVHQEYLKTHYPNVKKIAFLCPDDPANNISFGVCIDEAESRGFESVYQERFPTDTQDFYPIITKLLAKDPDGIDVTNASPQWAISIVNQARELGFTGPICSDLMMGDPNRLIANIKPVYANDIFEAAWDVRSDKMLPEIQQLRATVEKAGFDFYYESTHALLGSRVIMEGIKYAQSLDTDKVKTALETMSSMDTPYGPGTWQGADLGAIPHHLFRTDKVGMSWIMNGQIQFEWVSR